MSKERLEELAYNVAVTFDGRAVMSGDDYAFLYEYAEEQAERIQELEEVLEFYADENTYKDIKYKMIYMDGVPTEPPSGEPALIKLDEGAKAREILRGLKK